MTDPSTTAISTAAIDAKLTKEERAYLDQVQAELNRRQKCDAAIGQRGRDARSAAIESLVVNTMQTHWPALRVVHPCFWTQMIRVYLQNKGIKPPDRETIKPIIDTFLENNVAAFESETAPVWEELVFTGNKTEGDYSHERQEPIS